jgi:SAM-dependent methyltransferase
VTTIPDSVHPVRRPVNEEDSRRANRGDWDAYADEYQRTHGDFLGDAGFVWGPEGHQEAELGVLGPADALRGARTLEIGSGAGQCSRWLRGQGAYAVGLDLSERQLQHSRRLDEATGVVVPSVCGTATALPFADECFDVAFSSFGALQFVADADLMLSEVARVVRRGGTFAFSVTHPIRWAMPDDAGPEGLAVTSSYWDRTPYVEEDDEGRPRYVEHHRTLGDWVALLHRHGFVLRALHEPQWPEGHERVWGGWGPLRGRLIPGTAIFVADRASARDPVPAE